MARGRMISATISVSRKFAALANDTHRLIYLMVLPHVDKAGRYEADPVLIKGQCLTRLDIEPSTVEAWLKDAVKTGLLRVYKVGELRVLEIVDFLKHNTPHYKEPDSGYPPPDAGTPMYTEETNVAPTSGQRRVNVEAKSPIIEEKRTRREEKNPPSPPLPADSSVGAARDEEEEPDSPEGVMDDDLSAYQRRQLTKPVDSLASSQLVSFFPAAHAELVRFAALAQPGKRASQREAQFAAWAQSVVEDCRVHTEAVVVDALKVTIDDFHTLTHPFRYYRACLKNPRKKDRLPSEYREVTAAEFLEGSWN